MQSFVYKSTRKSDTYIFLADKEKVDDLPDGLERLLGKLEYVMAVNLEKRAKLANADIEEVKKCIANQGYYLQLPREEHIAI